LDVQMPGLNGLGVVGRLREKEIELPHFSFVTAYDQYAVEAFRLEAMDYLLKPVDKGRLAETLDRARRSILDNKALDNKAPENKALDNRSAAEAQPVPKSPPPAPRTKL